MRHILPYCLLFLIIFTSSVIGQNSYLANAGTASLPPEITRKLQQESPVLTFEDCAAIAVLNSYDISNAELELKEKNYSYIASRAALRSYIDMATTLPEYTHETDENYNSETERYDYFSVKKNEQNSRISFTQPLASNGKISGNLYAERFEQEGKIPEFLNRLDIRFDQPIFTPNRLQMDIFRSMLNLEKSKIEYIRRRVSLIYGYGFGRGGSAYSSLSRSIMGGRGGGRGGGMRGSGGSLSTNYYTVYKESRTIEIVQEYYDLLEELVALGEAKMNAGELSENEYLKLKVELTSSNDSLYTSKTRYEQSKRQLIQFLSIDPGIDFEVVQNMPYVPIKIDREKAISEGIANNTGIRNFKIDIELDSLSLITTRENARSEFRGSISGSVGMNKTDEIYRLYYEDFNESQSLKLSLAAPVWDRGRVGMRVKAKEIDFAQKKRQLVNDKFDTKRQILGHLYEIELMQERIELIRRARERAIQGLTIARRQFTEGNISIEDLLLAIRKEFESKGEYLNLLIDYKNTLIQLANQTQWDFEKNKSIRKEIELLIDTII